MALILDGKAVAAGITDGLRARVAALARPPGLAVVLVGEDPASQVYVRRKGELAASLGFASTRFDLPADAPHAAVAAVIDRLAADPAVDGILVQLPLPAHLDAVKLLERIPVDKDVDGITSSSAGWLSIGRPMFAPCTPKGVMRLLASANVPIAGRTAVVIGRSNIVGRPMARLLELADATVTICHSRTPDFAKFTREADIVVAAAGRPRLLKSEHVREGAAVIDVGIHRVDGKLIGDVDFAAVSPKSGVITPVPGGVGPMTIAMLMENTVEAAERRRAP
jgi:methylenetetrahydrofolate dehydrogenase (NADP+)/methenyltetrahydrofolate cyclohydrolase